MKDVSKTLIEQASKGNISSFEELYRITCDFVYNVALRIVNNKVDAEEVTQDVFMKIYNNLGRFRFKSSFKTWVYRITVNTAINAYKRKAKERAHRSSYDIALKTYTVDDGEDSFKRENNERILKYLLSKLNLAQRSCIVLREIEGLSYKEISRVLKININTVRSRIKRARLSLLAYGREVTDYEL